MVVFTMSIPYTFYYKGVANLVMRRLSSRGSLYSLQRGFTIVELAIVIVVIAILVGLTMGSTAGFQEQARDGERISDIDVIARTLESNYRTQAVATGATYPATSVGAAGFNALITDADALKAPDKTTSSIVIASSNLAQEPPFDQYVYQPLNVDESLCTTAPCVKFKLYYRLEKDGVIVTKNSMRQQ